MLNRLLLLFLLLLSISCDQSNEKVDEFLNQKTAASTEKIFLECQEINLEMDSVSDNQAVLNISSPYENHLVYQKDLDIFKPLKLTESDNVSVLNLDYLTEYEFKVIAIDANYSHCSSNSLKVETSEKVNYKSCQEILDYNTSYDSGVYEITLIDDSTLDVYCHMNGADGWTQILFHDVVNGGLFNDRDEALSLNENDPESSIYSILSKLDFFKQDGLYTFWLHYPDVDNENSGNFWSQSSNPTSELIADYTPISIDHNSSHWGGLERGNSNTFINGSTGHSNWWYAVGSFRYYGGTKVPGPSVSVEKVILYVK